MYSALAGACEDIIRGEDVKSNYINKCLVATVTFKQRGGGELNLNESNTEEEKSKLKLLLQQTCEEAGNELYFILNYSDNARKNGH